MMMHGCVEAEKKYHLEKKKKKKKVHEDLSEIIGQS